MSRKRENPKRQKVLVKADDLFDAWQQALELRKYAVPGYNFWIIRNEDALKRASSIITDLLKDLNQRHGAEGERLSGSEALVYQKERDAITGRMIKVKIYKIPLEILDDIDDITAMAYCLPMLEYEEDDEDEEDTTTTPIREP